jgi:hypothetical protein
MQPWQHPCIQGDPELPADLKGKSAADIAVALATRQLIGELTSDMGMSLAPPEEGESWLPQA